MNFDQARHTLQEHPTLMVGVARYTMGTVRSGGTLMIMGGTGGGNPRLGVGLMSALTGALPA
jgi:hypothetical protein